MFWSPAGGALALVLVCATWFPSLVADSCRGFFCDGAFECIVRGGSELIRYQTGLHSVSFCVRSRSKFDCLGRCY